MREQLARHDMIEELFQRRRKAVVSGLMPKDRQIYDASLVSALKNRNTPGVMR